MIATLWRLDGKGAAELAAGFYQHFPGEPAAQVLAAAQREPLAAPTLEGPYYWVGYMLERGGDRSACAKRGALSVR